MFALMARSGFLVENGFQLLADDNLESEEWKRYRVYARANLTAITVTGIQLHAGVCNTGNCVWLEVS
jgi:N-acetylglutamate synthase-like GNAT family acetyltransferase